MFASILSTSSSFFWMALICACTIVGELTVRRGRPLIPAPAVSTWPTAGLSTEYYY